MFENFQGVNPMIPINPWSEYKNKQVFTNMKMKQTTLWRKTEKLQGINPMVLSAPWADYKNKQLFTKMKM